MPKQLTIWACNFVDDLIKKVGHPYGDYRHERHEAVTALMRIASKKKKTPVKLPIKTEPKK